MESENYFDFETANRDLTFELNNNENVAVIGKVGSGKTSLLLTLLKELCIVKGSIKINQRDISYAA